MDQFYSDAGDKIVLGRRLGQGGEGAVYSVHGQEKWVAKVYHDPVEGERAEKLRLMTQVAQPDLLKVAAWPVQVLWHAKTKAVQGFLMPRVSEHQEIHTLWSPAQRKQYFPHADWSFLLIVASNCALVFEALHRLGIIIGDVNQGNLLVSSQGMVTLIDCDSFQISTSRKTYPCEVGVAHFTPPELQGKSFAGLVRTPNHDNFGLAVVIFHLLFMGRHPFAGRYLGLGEKSLEECIQESLFAFGTRAHLYGMERPPQSLELSVLSPALVGLFEQAFSPSSTNQGRPNPSDWVTHLRPFLKSLVKCPIDPGHLYPPHLEYCPWCQLLYEGGPDFFITVSVAQSVLSPDDPSFGVELTWKKMMGLKFPPLDYSRDKFFSRSSIQGKPIPSLLRFFAVTRTTCFALLLVGMFLTCIPSLLLVGLITTGVFGVFYFICSRKWREEEELRLIALKQEFQLLSRGEKNFQDGAHHHYEKFEKARKNLENKKLLWDKLPFEERLEKEQLWKKRIAKARESFLRSQKLEEGVLSGLAKEQKDAFQAQGIETAWHVTEDNLAFVPGLSREQKGRLLKWRNDVMRQFSPSTGQDVPYEEFLALKEKYRELRFTLADQFNHAATEMQKVVAEAKIWHFNSIGYLKRLITNFEQARADANQMTRN